MSEYVHRVREQVAWGVWVTIDCVAFSKKGYQGSTINMLPCLDLAFPDGWRHEQLIDSFSHGLQLIVSELCAQFGEPIVVKVQKLEFNPADFQDEGLGYALAGWLIQEYELNVELPSVHYDKVRKRYIYPYEL